MIYNLDLVKMLIQKVIFMKENGRMMKKMVKEQKNGYQEIHIQVNIREE